MRRRIIQRPLRGPHPLSTRLHDEWRSIRRRPHLVARARRWGVTEQPFSDLGELVVLAGFGLPPSTAANEVLRRLVGVAHEDELAERVVLERLMPGLLGIVRKRPSVDPHGSLEELIGAACLAIHAYDTARRPHRVAANLVRDAGYRAFTAPLRRRSASEVCIDPHALDETPAVVVVSAAEELALLMAEARIAGIDQCDLDLFRALLRHGSPAIVAAERNVTTRTIRNHRDRTAARIRQLALVA